MTPRHCKKGLTKTLITPLFFSFFFSFVSHTHVYFPASSELAVVTGVVPSPPPVLEPSTFMAHRVQQSHCSSIFIECVANSRSRGVRKSIRAQEKVPTNLYESMHSGGLESTKLTYTRLEDNLIRHRGDRLP